MVMSVAQNMKHQMKEWLVNNALERYGRKQLWHKSWQCPGGVSNTARKPSGSLVYRSWFKPETKQILADVY
jgi:hypothetical protein